MFQEILVAKSSFKLLDFLKINIFKKKKKQLLDLQFYIKHTIKHLILLKLA